jgi:hypothetical protein
VIPACAGMKKGYRDEKGVREWRRGTGMEKGYRDEKYKMNINVRTIKGKAKRIKKPTTNKKRGPWLKALDPFSDSLND